MSDQRQNVTLWPSDSSSSVAVAVMVWSFRVIADTEGGEEVGDEREMGGAGAVGCTCKKKVFSN